STSAAHHLLDDVAGHERDIGGTLCEAAHEVRIPLCTERNIAPHPPALADDLLLQVAANPVQHLEFEAIGLDVVLACELLHLLDYDFVVRGDAGIGTVQDETLHARDVIRVHVALFGKRNARRLLVRTLAYAHASTERIHVLDVRLCSIQIALEHYADSPAKFRIKTIFEQLQRLLCVVARFHVESDEAAVLARPFEYVAHYRDAQLFGNVQTHRRELHAHIRIELLTRDAIENLQVLRAGSSRLGFVVNALAEQVERRCDSATVELPNRGNRSLERLASDEAGGEPLGQAICLDELENSRLVGKIEQCVSDHLTCITGLLG